MEEEDLNHKKKIDAFLKDIKMVMEKHTTDLHPANILFSLLAYVIKNTFNNSVDKIIGISLILELISKVIIEKNDN